MLESEARQRRAIKISWKREFEWIPIKKRRLKFGKTRIGVIDLGLLGVFYVMNCYFEELFSEIQDHFQYIWTYFEICFCIYSKLSVGGALGRPGQGTANWASRDAAAANAAVAAVCCSMNIYIDTHEMYTWPIVRCHRTEP